MRWLYGTEAWVKTESSTQQSWDHPETLTPRPVLVTSRPESERAATPSADCLQCIQSRLWRQIDSIQTAQRAGPNVLCLSASHSQLRVAATHRPPPAQPALWLLAAALDAPRSTRASVLLLLPLTRHTVRGYVLAVDLLRNTHSSSYWWPDVRYVIDDRDGLCKQSWTVHWSAVHRSAMLTALWRCVLDDPAPTHHCCAEISSLAGEPPSAAFTTQQHSTIQSQ